MSPRVAETSIRRAPSGSSDRADPGSASRSGERVLAAVDMAAEAHALLRDLAQLRQRHHLEAAGVGEDGLFPAHEFVQAAKARDALRARAQHQVISVAEHDVGAGGGHALRQHRLHRARRADRHESGCADDAARRADNAGHVSAVFASEISKARSCVMQGITSIKTRIVARNLRMQKKILTRRARRCSGRSAGLRSRTDQVVSAPEAAIASKSVRTAHQQTLCLRALRVGNLSHLRREQFATPKFASQILTLPQGEGWFRNSRHASP